MSSYIAGLKEDIENGFSKRQLEILIDLPTNSLSGIISGKKPLSKKSIAKIKKWNASEKPDPLTLGKIQGPITQVTDLNKSNVKVKKFGKKAVTNFTIDTTKNKNIPPIPVKKEGEDPVDFAAKKNEWKRQYGQ